MTKRSRRSSGSNPVDTQRLAGALIVLLIGLAARLLLGSAVTGDMSMNMLLIALATLWLAALTILNSITRSRINGIEPQTALLALGLAWPISTNTFSLVFLLICGILSPPLGTTRIPAVKAAWLIMASPEYLHALQSICQPIKASDYPRALTPMRQLLTLVGDPQKAFPAVVVAGSVGKGTTCQHIALILRGAGLNVGLYTSPHLHSFRERFVINEQMIAPETFVNGAQVIRTAVGKTQSKYSTFEQATALALWWFAQEKIDIAVLEIGIGGRWDAVNAVPNVLAVFASIEPEHLIMLGGSLQSIAWRKAGIIHHGGHAITTRQTTDVMAILQHEADYKNAHLQRADAGPGAQPQEQAAYLALKAYQSLLERKVITRTRFQMSAQPGRLAGRLEQIQVNGRQVLIDGGHTPLAAQALRNTIEGLVRQKGTVRIVVGLLQDKNISSYLDLLDAPRFHLVLTQAPGHRGLSAQALLEKAHLEHSSFEVEPDLKQALQQAERAPEALFVVAGSLRMAAAAREYFGLLSAEESAEAQITREIFEGDDYLAKLRFGESIE